MNLTLRKYGTGKGYKSCTTYRFFAVFRLRIIGMLKKDVKKIKFLLIFTIFKDCS